MTRNLIICRGAMGTGKSTFLKDNGLEKYVISPDLIRTQFHGPNHEVKTGRPTISSSTEGKVWEFIHERMDERMHRGETIIIDATHVKQSAITAYREKAKRYHYRTTTIEFREDENVILNRNAWREPFKVVPEDVVRNAITRMETEYVPKWANPVTPEEFLETFKWKKTNMSDMKESKLLVIGDIHGSFDVLRDMLVEYATDNLEHGGDFTATHKIPVCHNTRYIFLGDYFDRGNKIPDTWDLMTELQQFENVTTLEGNHETHLKDLLLYLKDSGETLEYLATEESLERFVDKDWRKENKELFNLLRSKKFREQTLPILVEHGVTTSAIRDFASKLNQLALFETGNNGYEPVSLLMTHGGLSSVADDLIMYSTEELVNGTGTYSDDIDAIWNQNNKGFYQFHGHRNQFENPIINGQSFNLEGGVEMGGHLRAVEFDGVNFRGIERKNDSYNGANVVERANEGEVATPRDFAMYALENPREVSINTQANGNMSFNFSSWVFKRNVWNSITSHARGLFMHHRDDDEWDVIGRSYNKFFNDEQVRATEANVLRQTVKFPARAFKKYNGFLGLIGYDKTSDAPFVASKSVQDITVENTYANWVKDTFIAVYGEEMFNKTVLAAKALDATFVFEVINPSVDAHIVYYTENKMVLLDVIDNSMEFRKLNYEDLLEMNEETFGGKFEVKELEFEFLNWHDYYQWYLKEKESFKPQIEGYVLEEVQGGTWVENPYMWKVKSLWYLTWKSMRGSISRIATINGASNNPQKHGRYFLPIQNKFIKYIQNWTEFIVEINKHGQEVKGKYLRKFDGELIKEAPENMAEIVHEFYSSLSEKEKEYE